jgi:hypothetical protein
MYFLPWCWVGPTITISLPSRVLMAERAAELLKRRVKSTTESSYKNKLVEMGTYFTSLDFTSEYTGPPIILDGKWPLPPVILAALVVFFGNKTKQQGEESGDGEDGDEEEEEEEEEEQASESKKKKKRPLLMSNSHVSSYKAALKWLYVEKAVVWPPENDAKLGMILKGFKKVRAEMQAKGLVPNVEGRANLKFPGYCCLGKAMMEVQPTSSMPSISTPGKKSATHSGSWQVATMGWAFLLFGWNLIARSITVDNLNEAHLGVKDDHLTVFIGGSKKDLTGEKSAGFR